MAITRVAEQWTGREAEFGDQYDRKYTRKFVVETDRVATSAIAVGFALGIPRVFSPYFNPLTGEIDYLARCTRVQPVQREDAPLVWDVTCEYATSSGQPADGSGVGPESGPSGDPNKPGEGGASDKPEDRPPKIKWRQETINLPFERALAPAEWPASRRIQLLPMVVFDPAGGFKKITKATDRWLPVLNAAGQRFDPFPTYEAAILVLDITRIEPAFDAELSLSYAYALNEDQFLFAAPGQAQILPIESELVWIGGQAYFETHYKIRFCPDNLLDWQPLILNAGRKQMQGNPTDYTKPATAIIDKLTMTPVTEDVPLNEFGKALPPQTIANGPLVYMQFQAYPTVPFGPLNFPLNLLTTPS
jgi:hypothetical protein